MQTMDSMAISKMINFEIKIDPKLIATNYSKSKEKIEESKKGDKVKSYKTLRSTLKECYLTGSLKYGNNFIY